MDFCWLPKSLNHMPFTQPNVSEWNSINYPPKAEPLATMQPCPQAMPSIQHEYDDRHTLGIVLKHWASLGGVWMMIGFEIYPGLNIKGAEYTIEDNGTTLEPLDLNVTLKLDSSAIYWKRLHQMSILHKQWTPVCIEEFILSFHYISSHLAEQYGRVTGRESCLRVSPPNCKLACWSLFSPVSKENGDTFYITCFYKKCLHCSRSCDFKRCCLKLLNDNNGWNHYV